MHGVDLFYLDGYGMAWMMDMVFDLPAWRQGRHIHKAHGTEHYHHLYPVCVY